MGLATGPFWVIVEDKFSVGDTLYIQDMDKIGILDDILYMEDGNTMLVIELGETFVLTPIEDSLVVNLDDEGV